MKIEKIIQQAFIEDLPEGDITTDSLETKSCPGTAKLIAKEDLILSGSGIFEKCIQYMEPRCEFRWMFKDSEKVLAKQTICVLKGNLVQILKAERVGLNFLGRLSGISTLTKAFSVQLLHTHCSILDTRKTTPLLRELEKKAVLDGGGANHRMNLSDQVMIKENHVRLGKTLAETIDQIRSQTDKTMTVEAHTLEDVKVCIEKNVDRILLDNMDNETLRKAIGLIPKHIATEASGNMTLERVASVAETGVQFISVGALTHSAKVADISLLFEWPL